MKALKLAAAALAALALAGCVTIMNSGDYYNSINDARKLIKQANHAYEEDQRVYTEVTKRSSSPQAAPYPSLAAHLAGMKAQVDIMNAQDQDFARILHAYESIAKNRHELKSDMPEWQAAMANRDEAIALSGKLQAEGNAFNKDGSAFAREADAAGVGHIKSSDYKKKLKGQFGALEKAANQVHAKIADAKAKLSQGISLGGGKEEALATLDRMSAIADKIEARSRPFEAKVKAFIDSTTDEDIWRGPGVAKVAVVEDLNKAIQDLQPLIDKFNAEVDKLKK